MRVADVYELLGPPLASRPEKGKERWCYGKQPLIQEGGGHVEGSALVRPTCVVFDDNERVLEVTGDISVSIRKGVSASDVLELLGDPRDRVPVASMTLHYTRPGGERLFRSRIVAVSRDGRVSDVISYQFYD